MNDIINLIPHGKENAISRLELRGITGMTERGIRERIKQANFALCKKGLAIVSSSRKSGYWITDNLAEIKEYLREAERRSNTLRKNNKPVYDLLKRLENTV